MPKIQITAKGIRAALKKYVPYQSLTEYVWNGFDAQASIIKIDFTANELGNIESISISDNGYGIPHDKLQDKFEPLFESKKALENKLKKNLSAIHGKNGIGRLTFFTFARNAAWKTVYHQNDTNLTYEIYANAENINLYTGVNAVPRQTEEETGTTVTFSGIHGLTSHQLEEKFQEYMLKEFAWFLALNRHRNFAIIINGTAIDFQSIIADSEKFELEHEETKTVFFLYYVRWDQRLNNEPSRYYYINSEHKERWKEPTAIKNKGEQFYHSFFIESAYFDAFSFQSADSDQQEALIAGTRSDAQFKFLRKKLANILRIKRRPFLKGFAEQLLLDYEQKNILPTDAKDNLKQTIKILYEMQPKIFTSLNLEQKKILVGLLGILLESNKTENVAGLLGGIIELTPDEQSELTQLFL
ncbi:MAG: ATP-binding protein [Candidatus Moranbacteria bacterium]|nr:ATP-binding protein [Candidatus Moranbacteria bacterium]